MRPSRQFWQGDYLSTSCQNVAISEDPARVAQMILPDIRSASVSDDTLSRHTALVPPNQHRGIVQFADESQGWAKVRSEKKVRF